jgi:cytochrome P450
MYDIAHPRHTLHFLRDKHEHSRRRRDWRRGFDGPSLAAYEPKIAQCVSQLTDLIMYHVDQPVNAANMFNLFSFDTMGVLGFGHSFGRMKSGEMDYYMKSLHKNTLIAGAFFQMPWLVHILKGIPLFNVQYTSFIHHSRLMAEERIRHTTKEPSIFGPVVEAYEHQKIKTKQCRHNLYGDADLIVVAGSDTIAAVLSSASFCLALYPDHAEAVRRLLRRSPQEASVYIDAVIYETLRLHPVIASGLQRVTPPEGLCIGKNVYIPGDTRVQTPSYVMFRDERNFVKPNEFMPERFMGHREELVHDMSVYIPFNTGIYSCIGKQLAMKELNMALTELVKRFEFRLAPGQTEAGFLRSKRDTFTLFIRDLQLIFTPLNADSQKV